MLSCTFEDFSVAMDAVICSCLDLAGIEAPPVDPQVVRDALGIIPFAHRDESSRGAMFRKRASTFVSIRPEVRPERWCWSLAHEIGETQVPEIERRIGCVIGQPDREEICNRFASMLLVPARWFPRDCSRLGFSLPDLKALYSSASNEVIARRMLDLEDEPSLITVWDQGRRWWRKPTPWTPVQPIERAAQRAAHASGEISRFSDGSLTAVAWPIHEGPVRREIVRLSWEAGAA